MTNVLSLAMRFTSSPEVNVQQPLGHVPRLGTNFGNSLLVAMPSYFEAADQLLCPSAFWASFATWESGESEIALLRCKAALP